MLFEKFSNFKVVPRLSIQNDPLLSIAFPPLFGTCHQFHSILIQSLFVQATSGWSKYLIGINANNKILVGDTSVDTAINGKSLTLNAGHITASGNISASGTFYGNQFYYTHHNYTGDVAEEFIPINSLSEQGAITYPNQWIAPFDGELKKVLIYASTDPNSTVVKMYKNGSAQDTDTVDMDATTTATFNFSSSFSSGDRLSVSVTPTDDPGNVNVTCVWLYNTST